ncbi:hypothetical protein C1Y40_04131 [Mycobacterium talmoniae]|uniref:Metallothionein n=1 Tax=Mycobacterium talmoniae TaxID=1858794 RepID=A0A2S8BG92_9MYCO|nr:hypothetical protein C1Y40_04131 [Mycobacterium talmoniae]
MTARECLLCGHPQHDDQCPVTEAVECPKCPGRLSCTNCMTARTQPCDCPAYEPGPCDCCGGHGCPECDA